MKWPKPGPKGRPTSVRSTTSPLTPPLIRSVNADEEHIRAVLEFIRSHKNVSDYELLPCHRFGLGKYEHLGVVYELDDYKTPSDELVAHLQAIIDEAFGRGGK